MCKLVSFMMENIKLPNLLLFFLDVLLFRRSTSAIGSTSDRWIGAFKFVSVSGMCALLTDW